MAKFNIVGLDDVQEAMLRQDATLKKPCRKCSKRVAQ